MVLIKSLLLLSALILVGCNAKLTGKSNPAAGNAAGGAAGGGAGGTAGGATGGGGGGEFYWMMSSLMFDSGNLYLLNEDATSTKIADRTFNSAASPLTEGGIYTYNEQAITFIDDDTSGNELHLYLFALDGTQTLVKALEETGTNPEMLSELNDEYFFFFNTAAEGTELWKTDGTPGGTGIVKDIQTGAANGAQTSVSGTMKSFIFKGSLYFVADDGANGAELWKTDGTNGGTVMVEDLTGDAASSSPENFLVFDDYVYFNANSGKIYQLKTADVITEVVSAVSSPIRSGEVSVEISGHVIFEAQDNGGDYKIFIINETTNAVTKIAMSAVASTMDMKLLNVYNNKILFIVRDGASNVTLYESGTNGVASSIQVLTNDGSATDISQSVAATTSTGMVITYSNDGDQLTEKLYQWNGTALTDVAATASALIAGGSYTYTIYTPNNYGNTVYRDPSFMYIVVMDAAGGTGSGYYHFIKTDGGLTAPELWGGGDPNSPMTFYPVYRHAYMGNLDFKGDSIAPTDMFINLN